MSAVSLMITWFTLFAEASACPQDAAQIVMRVTADGGFLAQVDASVAAHCARSRALVAGNCSYTTGMVARRVVEEGADWTSAEEALAAVPNTLSSLVAAPYRTTDGAYLIANELVELLASGGHARARLVLGGKVLEVDGVRYVVLTSFQAVSV